MGPAGWGRRGWRWIGWDDAGSVAPSPAAVSVPDPSPELLQRAAAVRRAAMDLGRLSDGQRRDAVLAMADALQAEAEAIVAANGADLEAAAADGLAPALVARLKLDATKLAGAIDGVRQVAQLPDPLGVRQLHRELDDGLVLERLSVPLGVLGVIFEARPDAVMQIASLAVRSGNGALLKGGREASRSCAAILGALRRGLAASAVAPEALELLTSREESLGLLKLDGLVDLIIPRGSNELVRFIQDNTRIPVLGHADGICHLYVDREVDIPQAVRVAIDAKTQYPAACNAIETLLLHRQVAEAFLQQALPAFAAAGYRVIAYSRRGFNGSSKSDPKNPGVGADDLHAFADLLKLPRFHLLGSAAGGRFCMDYALTHPERLISLTISSNPGGATEGAINDVYVAIRPDNWRELPRWFWEVGPSYRARNPEGVKLWDELEHKSAPYGEATNQGNRNTVTPDALGRLKLPVHLLTGDADLADRKSTRLNSSHVSEFRMPSSA